MQKALEPRQEINRNLTKHLDKKTRSLSHFCSDTSLHSKSAYLNNSYLESFTECLSGMHKVSSLPQVPLFNNHLKCSNCVTSIFVFRKSQCVLDSPVYTLAKIETIQLNIFSSSCKYYKLHTCCLVLVTVKLPSLCPCFTISHCVQSYTSMQ